MSEAMSRERRAAARPVTVRLAGPADAAAVYALVVELAGARGVSHKVASSVEDIARDGFGADPAFEALLAELDGAPVGLCLFFGSYSTWRGRRGLYVQDLVVRECARGLGLGERLLAAAAALCAARGGCYLRLSVEAGNTAAQRFYRRAGLEHSAAEQIYLLEDAAFDALAAGAESIPS